MQNGVYMFMQRCSSNVFGPELIFCAENVSRLIDNFAMSFSIPTCRFEVCKHSKR